MKRGVADYYSFGSQVCGIVHLPYDMHNFAYDESAKEHTETLKCFSKEIGALTYRYIFAITANYFQKTSKKVLIKHAFAPIITFESEHGLPETLTLWIKTQKKYDAKQGTRRDDLPSGNCSVLFRKGENHNLVLLVSKRSLKRFKFTQVRKTPIWFRVKKRARLTKTQNERYGIKKK